jgi:DNA-binding NarL/FixJ family response regulator
MLKRVRMAVVDSQPLFREGVACILKTEPVFDLVAVGAGCEDAVKITIEKSPDLLLLDIEELGSGIGAMKRIAVQSPSTKVIVMSASVQVERVFAVFDARARGYFLKSETGQALIQAVKAICNGGSYVTPSIAARVFEHARRRKSASAMRSGLVSLTRRETGILNCVGLGLTNKEIAIRLGITEKTVKHYMTNIMSKLQVHNRVQAALIAHKSKTISTPMNFAS